MPNQRIVEFVSGKLKAGVDRETFLAAASKSQTLLQQYKGYVSRSMLVLEEIAKTINRFPALIRRDVGFNAETEQWLEVIYYRDRESADAMFTEIKDAACMQACMELLDETTLTMIMATPVLLNS